MIGSLMSRLGAAEKLSIPQLQKAIQDGTLPAFVGVPLLQQKVQESKQAQMAAAGAGPQPSIAQQVMQEAQGIESARSNLPETYADGGILNFQPVNTDDSEHEYAGGGMIAFDDGGDVEEDDDSSEDIDFGGMNKEEEKIFNSLRASYMEPSEHEGIAGLQQQMPTGQGIRPEAKAPRGIDTADFTEKIKRLESGGRHYDKQGNILTSSKGAEGIMQVMPHTQRDPGFGVMAARDSSPAELERVGIEYANAMLRKYGGNEKLAAMAYNWGPGNVDRWIAGGMKGEVPKETRQYASNFAQGGIAHFDDGGYTGFWDAPEYGAPGTEIALGERLKNLVTYGKFSPDTIVSKQATQKAEANKVAKDGKFNVAPAPVEMGPPVSAMNKEEPAKETGKTEETAINDPYKQYIDELSASIKSREERLNKQRETDKYMALLSAGLKMMAGTSPHGMVNIGEGGREGIQAALANRKAQIAEENAIASSRLGLTRADLYRGMHLEDIKQKALARGDMQAYRQADLAIKQQKADIAARLAPLQVQKANIAAEKLFSESGKADIEAQLKEEFGKEWRKDTKAQAEYKRRRAAWIRDNVAGGGEDVNSFETLMRD